jgi:phage baseplate assembly protein W
MGIVTTGVYGGVNGGVIPVVNNKKFTVVDNEAVVQDLINAFNIPQGSKPGNPSYGTSLWGLLFEPNTTIVQNQVEQEVRRIIEQDPRIIPNIIEVSFDNNTILVQVEIAISPNNEVLNLQFIFDQAAGIATLA